LREARTQKGLYRHRWNGMEAHGIKKHAFVFIIEVHYIYKSPALPILFDREI